MPEIPRPVGPRWAGDHGDSRDADAIRRRKAVDRSAAYTWCAHAVERRRAGLATLPMPRLPSRFPEGEMTMAAPNSCRRGLVLACAALIAQVVLAGSGSCCDPDCCTGFEADRCCPPSSSPATRESACPLCQAVGGDQGQQVPCRCHLDARHDAVATAPARAPIGIGAIDHDFVVLFHDLITTPRASLFRRMLEASRVIPSRPPRITFGVWRN